MNTRNMSLLDVPHRTLELQTNLREDFTIKETAPTRAIFWLRRRHKCHYGRMGGHTFFKPLVGYDLCTGIQISCHTFYVKAHI